MSFDRSPLNLPPNTSLSPWGWAQKRLFNTWYNIVLTLGALLAIGLSLKGFLFWATTQAQWAVVSNNLKLFLVGRFPNESLWRLWVILSVITLLSGLSWGKLQAKEQLWRRSSLLAVAGIAVLIALFPISLLSRLRSGGLLLLLVFASWVGRSLPGWGNRFLLMAWVLSVPLIFWLLRGGFGLQEIQTTDWSGLLLTILAAVISIALSFPLGVLLALGRQSKLPVVQLFSTLYIEVLRGLPLIGVLFIALVMLPLLLPPSWSQPDQWLRGIAGLILFSAAYVAEVVRGGLQAVPKGQIEAADALGLPPLLVTGLILLPQALKITIPALVGEFVSLFKETTLLSVFGLIELLGISASILGNPDYVGRYAEVYLFVGIIYWLFCYAMSIASQCFETSLQVDRR